MSEGRTPVVTYQNRILAFDVLGKYSSNLADEKETIELLKRGQIRELILGMAKLGRRGRRRSD